VGAGRFSFAAIGEGKAPRKPTHSFVIPFLLKLLFAPAKIGIPLQKAPLFSEFPCIFRFFPV
jgi:hypothetical protein